jgi:hypothetical protein
MTRSVLLRRKFLAAFWRELHVVWPILSALISAQLLLGLIVGYLEGWRIVDATYFTFVTGLTIGYGDLVPMRLGARLISILIGFSGILLTGLVAAVGVRALQEATRPDGLESPDSIEHVGEVFASSCTAPPGGAARALTRQTDR